MKAQPPLTIMEKLLGVVAVVSPILGLIAVATLMGGCQTRITAEKFPEQIVPVYINGGAATNYIVASGGWYMTARSPLWADETLKGLKLDIGRGANHVGFELADYSRDLSTNAVAMVDILAKAASDITAKVCAAIVSHGGSVAAGGVSSLVSRFLKAGGDASKASVSCADGACTITDGATTCTDGGCFIK